MITGFTLAPDETDAEGSARGAPQLRLVGTGLAPTADLPARATKGPDRPPAYAPCVCGTMVLTGITGLLPGGERIALEVHSRTFVVDWDHGEAFPMLRESRGYPVHRCAAGVHRGMACSPPPTEAAR